ncbi:MAG: NAD-dependent epimerase/dehydratase family protein [Patescibacteria group bacterium]
MEKILITGTAGQIGSELVPVLHKKHGPENIVLGFLDKQLTPELLKYGHGEIVDVTDKEMIRNVLEKHRINTIYHLAGILSASGEKNPNLAWRVNLEGLKNILDLALEYKVEKVFWPSSIAAFGPTTPRDRTPQRTILEPTTMYGLNKVAGELLCQYYFHKFGLDVRSLRYPGVISWKTEPGGGTTDYAVAIYYEAVKGNNYECFLKEDTALPMMYMDDAVKATIDLMEAPKEKISVRTSYNLAAVSFTPQEVFKEIKKHYPKFKVTYAPDFRQAIADSWPKSIDDSQARKDWGWKHEYDLAKMTEVMIRELKKKLGR